MLDHSHSVVRIAPNELICRRKKFSALRTPVAQTVRCAWLLNSKRNLVVPENLHFQRLSISIGPIFSRSNGGDTPPTSPKTTVAARGIDRDVAWAIAARLPTGLWQASPAICCASVARYRQPREKRSIRGEPAGYELSEEPHALRLACLPLCEKPHRSVHMQVGTRHPHQ